MLVIKNAKIFTSAQKVYEKGDILIESGKIKAIAESLETPEGAQIIDANGLTAMPGMVDAHSHIGLFGDGNGQDANEMTCNATPQIESYYGIDPEDKAFERVCKAALPFRQSHRAAEMSSADWCAQ